MASELLLQVTIPVVAQSYLQEVPRVASGPVVGAGVVPHGVVAVHRPASLLVQTRQDVVHIVWEEPLVVHEDRHHLRGGWCGHRLVVLLSKKNTSAKAIRIFIIGKLLYCGKLKPKYRPSKVSKDKRVCI